jgi:hypothetical protein
MKTATIAVPDCYGTYEMDNRHCFDAECSAAYYCRDETCDRKERAIQLCEFKDHTNTK